MQPATDQLSRRDRERLARREAMLDAASEAFGEKGYADATLEEIAARAEFGKGTLYNYFPGGKQELLLAVFDRLYTQLRSLIAETLDRDDDSSFEERLKEFFHKCFSFFLDRLNLFMVLIREAHRLGFSEDAGSRGFFSDQREQTIEALAAPIERAIEAGELRDLSPRMLAHMILTNVKGCQMQSCLDSRPEDQRPAAEMAEILTELLMRGAIVHEPIPAS